MTVTPKFSTPIYYSPEGDGGGEAAPAGTEAPAADAGTEAPAGVEADAGTEAPAGTEEAAPAAEPLADPDDGTIPEALKPYVKQLREEAAERRVALKPYEDVFSAFEPEETQALLSVISGLQSEETQYEAATRLKEVVDAILGDGTEDPNRPLTRADLQRIEAEKQSKAQEEAAVQAVLTEAKELGYTEGSREARRLLDLAVNETKGDLKAAHAAIQAEKEAIIADYAKQVMEGKAKWPTLAPPVGSTPSDVSGEPPKTWAEARANAKARQAAMQG